MTATTSGCDIGLRQKGEAPVSTDDRLIAHLATSDPPCPVCGFNLRNITKPRCPECGAILELAVAAPNKKLAPFTFAVVSLGMGLGFDGVVLFMGGVATAINLVFFNGSLPAGWEPWVVGGLFAFGGLSCAGGILGMLRGQKHWFRARPRVQWWRAIAVFVGVFLGHLGLAAAILFVLN